MSQKKSSARKSDPTRDAAQRQAEVARKLAEGAALRNGIDLVEEASNESFPASDAPSWTETAASRNAGK